MLKLNHLTGFGSGAGAAGGDVTSYVFDGTGDYLSIPDHADWNFSTGNFTIEGWFKCDGWSTDDVILYDQYVDTNNRIQLIAANAGSGNTNLMMRITDGGANTNEYSGNIARVDNVWVHLAVVRDGNTMRFWGDGVDIGTSDCTGNDYINLAADIKIGDTDDDAGGTDPFSGYIDEYRISDTARYTSGFTPSTSQFTSDANTLLLIHGGEAYTGALTGETDQPVYAFDGTGDYLSVPDHADFQLGGGTGDFTVECWFKRTASGSTEYILGQSTSGEVAAFRISVNAANVLAFFIDSSATRKTVSATTTITDSNWHHVACVRHTSSNTLEIFLDGVSEDTVDVTGFTVRDNAAAFAVGAWGEFTSNRWNGEIAEVRISNTARWTSGFTVPTTRYTSDANTLLLIHGDEIFTDNALTGTTGSGATFTDSGNTGHTVTENGNAISGSGATFTDSGNTGHTVTENGNSRRETGAGFKLVTDGVGYFLDGTGDFLQANDHADWTIGSSEFTLEGFFKFEPAPHGVTYGLASHYLTTGNQRGWQLLLVQAGTMKLRLTWSTDGTSGTLASINSNALTIKSGIWYHIAVVRDSNTLRFFLEGVAVGTGDMTGVTIFNSTSQLAIGANQPTAGQVHKGYLDEIRISSTARYTSGFTPTTTQFTSDANTSLLIHCGETKSGTTGSGATFTDSGNTGHTITEQGNAIEATGALYKF